MTLETTSRTVVPRLVTALLLLCLISLQVLAQNHPTPPPPASPGYDGFNDKTTMAADPNAHGNGSVVFLSVYGDDGKTHLDRQSVVTVKDLSAHNDDLVTTNGKSEARFFLPVGKYDLEISAVGYLSEHKEFQSTNAPNDVPLHVTLQKDPAAVDLDIVDTAMPPKALKDLKHAVSALKSGNGKEAKAKLDSAYALAPANSDINFLLGYYHYQQNDLGKARGYLETATGLNPQNAQALSILGRIELTQSDYPAATSALERAVRINPSYWVAHHLLAYAYLNQKKYDEARNQAELAVRMGKQGAVSANLILGVALADLGKAEEGIQALKLVVQDSPKSADGIQASNLIYKLEEHLKDVARDKEEQKNNLALSATVPAMGSAEAPAISKAWQPPGIDEIKPDVAAGVTCPSQVVMEMSGERMKDLVVDVSRIGAMEHLLHERIDQKGVAASWENRDYQYYASISEQKGRYLKVDEERSERLLREDFVDGVAANGFIALALVFHPVSRQNFEMTCEGLGRWHDQAAWLVHFKQRDDRPANFQSYFFKGVAYPMKLKGRAWITADKYHIARIEAELVSSSPNIPLQSERQVVEYSPVLFQKKKTELWLPKTAEVYFDFHKHRIHRVHTFDHYTLFSVDTDEKRKEPVAPPVESQALLPN